ncbi:MAG: MFS transporter [Clostridia bacterium]|nr:MFS transporter [Clostridia bacterium]
MKKRTWAALILVGLVGQFAWTIENMYFNVFLYNAIAPDPRAIAWMVALSAVAATVTTLLMGALSDRVGKRKAFICLGYVLWGLSVMAFAWLGTARQVDRFHRLYAQGVLTGPILVVALDCVMTFFGSTANDAAFNAYVTDVTTRENRGRAESVLAILPLISMLVIFGVFDSWTQRGDWARFFLFFGGLMILTGLASLFLVKDSDALKPRRDSYVQNLLYGFTPKVIRSLPELYLSLLAFTLFSIGVQVFFPYLIVYFQHYLKMDDYALVLGVVLLFASLVSVLAGRSLDRYGKLNFVLPAAGVMIGGLVGLYFVRSMAGVMIAGAVMMSGYMLVTAALSALIRDYTPKDKAGHFQGVRMVFAVCLPMIVGPFIGSAVIRTSGAVYEDLGVVKSVPTPGIFLAAAVCVLLLVLPVVRLYRRKRT